MKKVLLLLLLPVIYLLNISFAEPETDPSTFYYMGEIKATSPDGISYGVYVALTKQTVNKKENTIKMESINIDQKGETKNYNYTIKVTNPNYVLTDEENNYKGTGIYKGKPWKWKSWNYTINYTNPVGKMVGKDFVSFWGLMVNKDFYGPDGKIAIHYHERHNFITKEQYEILYLQTLKASSK